MKIAASKVEELKKVLCKLKAEHSESCGISGDATNCYSRCGSTCVGACYNVRPPLSTGY